MQDLDKLGKPLRVDQIDFRVQSINKGGYATILAYKDARVDMQRLDEVAGPLNWKREHVNGNANCIVSIWNSDIGQWVSKEDTGTQSNTEAAKGLASDSFKRACFNWGIGRELYDYPAISIKLNQNEFKVDNNKAKPTWDFQLKTWKWFSEFNGDHNICILGARDPKGAVRFEWYDLSAVKEIAEFIVNCLANDELEQLGEAWAEREEWEHNLMWASKAKGGWFSTKEKETIRECAHKYFESNKEK